MPSLIFDTSTERGIVAIMAEDRVLFHADLPFGLQNAQFLLPEIHKGLQSTGLRLEDLLFVGVGIGPGSYTGMRVGATVAKTLTFACSIPLVGICSLDAFIPNTDCFYAAVIDAKIGGVYVQKGAMQAGISFLSNGPELCPLPRAAELLQDVTVLVSPNVQHLQSKLSLESHNFAWVWQECYPCPKQLSKVAHALFEKKHYSLDGQIDLLYLRKTQAELEKEAQKNR